MADELSDARLAEIRKKYAAFREDNGEGQEDLMSAAWVAKCDLWWVNQTIPALLTEIDRLKEYADDLAGQLPMI